MHIMKLQEKYFNYIKNGTKEYEIRLNDEKRKQIKIGDFIEFQKEPLKEEKIIYQVDNLLYFKNFKELINTIDISSIADINDSKEELLNSLNHFYSKEEQDKYGVVAIKLKKDPNFTIEKGKLSLINKDNNIFTSIKDNYKDFDDWYDKLINNEEECYFTKNNGLITSILILKINENDSSQIDKTNLLKIRTLNIIDNNKGIASFYLDIVEDIKKFNNIEISYLTCKKTNRKLINFLETKNFKLYKEIKDELVYIK